MITNKITIDKIVKATELVCPMFDENLITEAFIVGSVAKGTAKEDSDIDIYLINPDFKKQVHTHGTELMIKIDEVDINKWISENSYVYKIVDFLQNLNVEFKYISIKNIDLLWYGLYKNELFHFMYDYESKSIKKAGQYIEITKELCNEIND